MHIVAFYMLLNCWCYVLLITWFVLCTLCKTAKEPDSMDVLGARTYGISVLSACLPWFLLHNTRDATVHITLMMSFVVVSFGLSCALSCI